MANVTVVMMIVLSLPLSPFFFKAISTCSKHKYRMHIYKEIDLVT